MMDKSRVGFFKEFYKGHSVIQRNLETNELSEFICTDVILDNCIVLLDEKLKEYKMMYPFVYRKADEEIQ